MEDLCTACLCKGQKMRNLFDTDLVHIYSQILNEISVYDPSEVRMQLCWWCQAALQRFQHFRQRVQARYMVLRDCHMMDTSKLCLPHPSSLQIHHEPPVSIEPLRVDPMDDPVSIEPDVGVTDGFSIDSHCTDTTMEVEVKVECDAAEHEEPETFVHELPLPGMGTAGDGTGASVVGSAEAAAASPPATSHIQTRARRATKPKKKDKNKPKVKKKQSKSKSKGKAKNSEDISDKISLDSDDNRIEDVQSHTEETDMAVMLQECAEPKVVKKKRSREVLPERPTCIECNKVFSSRKTYRYHVNVLHGGNDRHPCKRCGKVFHWKSNLGRHMRSHKAADCDELHCQLCDKRFASIATYRQHLKLSRRHVEEKDFGYQCDKCHKKFVHKTRLRDHIDWEHLNKVKFRCTLCGKPFKCHTSLYVHKQNVHRDRDRRDNLCHVCGKSYQNPAKLKYHIVALHTSQTPYQCQQCDAAFGWYSSLYRHVREVHFKIKVQQKKSRKSKKEPAPVQSESLPHSMLGVGGDGGKPSQPLHLSLPHLVSQSMNLPH